MNIQENVDIKNYSTLKVGGVFRYFVTIEKKEDLSSLYAIAQSDVRYKSIPIFILGGGSNSIFSDGVLNVIATKIDIKGFEVVREDAEYVEIRAGAGEIWDELVGKTVEMSLSGLESLSAIPGVVGATPVQNVGAYGAEVKDSIIEVEVFDTFDKTIKYLSNNDCKFGYRDSIFKGEAKGRYIITTVTYKLKKFVSEKNPFEKVLGRGGRDPVPDRFQKDFSPALYYPDVGKYFREKKIENPNLRQIRQAVIEIRSNKLPNPKDIPNVGSFFKNPIVSKDVADQILINYPNAKFFPIDEKTTKVPAGWLIENAGLKGKSFGKVAVYDKNALVLINTGGATKEDIIKTKNEIIKIVQDKFGIILEQEPEVV